jgi:chromosome segregation protein
MLSNEKDRLKNDNKKIVSEKELLQKQQIIHKKDIESYDSKKKQVNDEYNKKSIKMDYLKEELKDLNETFVALSQNKNDISIKINNIELEIKHLENDIYNEYETTYLLLDPILIEGTKNLVLKDIQNEQYELNRKLKSLGTINIDSIEEYKMVKERHSFLTNQITDLNTAKQELEKIIIETSNSMAEQFSINFNAIQNHFSHVFSELFEGGKAEIYLTDPDNPMESNIEINAEPPGKKLRHISLLSGGEKSMVAIALLFGILRTKPTPFCVVDEIDAALDDQNIVRYSHFLTAAAKKNQFIVITHRKRTMEIADVIYGISMGKGGISKVLSLQVSDYKIS